MLFINSQDSYEMIIPDDETRIGLKISGGADSAIVAYMLALYAKTERPDLKIYPITGISEKKPFQAIFSQKVLAKIENLVDYKFSQCTAQSVRGDENYPLDQDKIVDMAYDKFQLHRHYAGITANPTESEAPELFDQDEFGNAWFNDRQKSTQLKSTVTGKSHRPLINVDKRGVAEHYNTLGVMEELFPLTRSCELHTTDFTQHCGECWFCRERYWGFNRYV